MKKPFKTIKKMIAILFTTLLVLVLMLFSILLIYSPGKPTAFLDENGKPIPGSISEKIFVDINGMKQGMIIKTKDSTHPVLLYLHGGLPDYFLSKKYPTGLEDYFTVVWWERRGSGLSYDADIPLEAITLEQLLSDTKELTNYLRKRFGKEKIYLMGRSGGTFIGIQAAARTPELYHAYIAVAQMTDQLKSETLAYEYMLEQLKEKGNRKMLRKLEAAPVSIGVGIPDAYLALRDDAMHSLGIGTTHDMHSIIAGMFLPSLTCRAYTINEKLNLWRAKSRSGVSILWDTILATDLAKEIPQVDIPIYFFHGIYDYTVSYPLAKEYFMQIKAPVKGFYTFNNSAHSPIFEEPALVRKIIETDVFNSSNSLSDKEQ